MCQNSAALTLFDGTPRPVESQIFAVGQYAVHHVSELVEEGAHLRELEQRGLVRRGLGEVGDHRTRCTDTLKPSN